MVRAILSTIFLVWALGFLWFVAALPQPADRVETDAVVVPTGAGGRIAQGLSVIEDGLARKLICKPIDVTYEIKQYTNPTEPLITTDLMKIQGHQYF